MRLEGVDVLLGFGAVLGSEKWFCWLKKGGGLPGLPFPPNSRKPVVKLGTSSMNLYLSILLTLSSKKEIQHNIPYYNPDLLVLFIDSRLPKAPKTGPRQAEQKRPKPMLFDASRQLWTEEDGFARGQRRCAI